MCIHIYVIIFIFFNSSPRMSINYTRFSRTDSLIIHGPWAAVDAAADSVKKYPEQRNRTDDDDDDDEWRNVIFIFFIRPFIHSIML